MPQPTVALNEEHLLHLAAVQCPDEDIADSVGCRRRHLRRDFGRLLRQTRAKARCNLRKMQWSSAMKGNVPMLQWLGRQYLAQQPVMKDAVEDRSILIRKIDRQRFALQRIKNPDDACPSA